jgi:hypothetical protein
MGGACLRDHRHPWPGGGPGGAAARRRGESQLADQPDPARADAGPEFLRAGGDADTLHQRVAQGQRHADTEPSALELGIRIGLTERLGHTLPVAHRHGDAISVGEREP